MNLMLLLKLLSPFHDSEAAWNEAKSQGLPPLLQAKVIGSIVAFGGVLAGGLGYEIAPDQLRLISDNLYLIITGGMALYGVVLALSQKFFPPKPPEIK